MILLASVFGLYAASPAATALCESTEGNLACVSNAHDHEPRLAQLALGNGADVPAAMHAAGPLEQLCRDYQELIERRAMVDRQQVALLPKFQILEEICLKEPRQTSLASYACTVPASKHVRGSCCVGLWNCFASNQASCDSMERLCKGLGAAWSKE